MLHVIACHDHHHACVVITVASLAGQPVLVLLILVQSLRVVRNRLCGRWMGAKQRAVILPATSAAGGATWSHWP